MLIELLMGSLLSILLVLLDIVRGTLFASRGGRRLPGFWCWIRAASFTRLLHPHQETLWFLLAFCHYSGIIRISEVVGVSPTYLDSSL